MINTEPVPNRACVFTTSEPDFLSDQYNPFQPLINNKLMNHFTDGVEWHYVSTLEKIRAIAETKKPGELGLLMFDGHGNPEEIAFETGMLSINNVHLYKDIFTKVHPGGIIILWCCCKGGENRLARKIHALTENRVKVCGAENSLTYSCYSFLIRSWNNDFEMHFFDSSSIDRTVIYENGQKQEFRGQSKQILELAQSQGYQKIRAHKFIAFWDLPEERWKLMDEQSERAMTTFHLATYYLVNDKDGMAVIKINEAVKEACNNSSLTEKNAMIYAIKLIESRIPGSTLPCCVSKERRIVLNNCLTDSTKQLSAKLEEQLIAEESERAISSFRLAIYYLDNNKDEKAIEKIKESVKKAFNNQSEDEMNELAIAMIRKLKSFPFSKVQRCLFSSVVRLAPRFRKIRKQQPSAHRGTSLVAD